eukprot:CAMPEP_0204482258 /NCGR_PEP_ID=MMETSP0471-20130131/50300_1 /ASSEMBLY_ACC=CAM_ASM_000602 /TAXON_ID=2969 /ORGANISM="Oxyrrhis marina" /LENGTH=33 /DNA_ID= /DNA_START= /DNA_END= /DNA_ORIENTATION=
MKQQLAMSPPILMVLRSPILPLMIMKPKVLIKK